MTELVKPCTKCGEQKPLALFYKKGEGKYGRQAQCKVCVSARSRKRYVAVCMRDPVFIKRNRERNLIWYHANKARSSVRVAKNHKAERLACINRYGPHCACCGETTYQFLSIDHIDGGGTQHRKSGISKICRWLIKQGFPLGFRVLCHNCNQAIGYYGACPHQATKT